MARPERYEVDEDGWTEWIPPVMNGYRMTCCDCGLVHEMDFKATEIVKRKASGSLLVRDLNPKKYQVTFRARRHNRATAATRRHRKK